ncbi:hypothetical protein BOTBODRAFT_124660 [Botryobasidium botryosum FD-172 SS1]|uniref:Uncharacterized protein n=1 Tax=Botryobasidium botryosum (strain FD-172 SS1) TaxID=930990 RepID=A0A067N1M0_BOTB1|nr:hypothetical protein BOTBODRAFT_124660 [Botryobasidium botryosum FD-172 SS1]
MVKVEEVTDARDKHPYAASSNASSFSASTDSLASDASSNVGDDFDDDVQEETFLDRVSALVDIVPPSTRASISSKVSRTVSAVTTTGKVVGNIVWIFTTSALLVGLPLALALEDEAKIVQQEKEIRAQQQGAEQMLSPSSFYPQTGSTPASGGGLVPPGF